jgi:hypothetical protein
MAQMDRRALKRKLEQTRRFALEPTDRLTRERMAQRIEELEFLFKELSSVNGSRRDARHNHYIGIN